MTLSTDADLVVEILLNLIRNASEASDAGALARISAALRDGAAVICVDDEGSSIPAHVRRRMFEPFFSTKGSGTGLGLPISQQLAAKLNGKIRLAPRSPRGTRARLDIPGAYLSSEEGGAA